MKTFVAIGALLAALLSLPLAAQTATPASVNAQLPAIGANNQIMPLTTEQLGPEEKAAFSKLKAGSAEATKFLHTRGFLRYARLVADNQLEPKKLPSLPDRVNWNRAHLSASEAKIVDDALGLKIRSRALVAPTVKAASATTRLPAVDGDGVIGPLTPQQLDEPERRAFAKLTPGSPEATKFLYTRGYLRFAKLVVDGRLKPLELPRLPDQQNWDRGYLSAKEATDILDAALGMKILARMQPAQ